jgi:hypothetical protein
VLSEVTKHSDDVLKQSVYIAVIFEGREGGEGTAKIKTESAKRFFLLFISLHTTSVAS